MCAFSYPLVTTLVIDHAGDAVAYTRVLVSGNDLHQEDTYVRPVARGRRLGAPAKARNLRALAVSHLGARHLHTWTAEVNDPMRRINESFGFRALETMYARLDDRAV